MEKYAEEYNIPIMERRGLKFLVDYIKSKNVKSILEIGTAIGYSTICMARSLDNNDSKITTIELLPQRVLKLEKILKKLELVRK